MLLVEFKLQIEAARSDMPLITELERQRQVDLSEFKFCLHLSKFQASQS